MLPLLDRIEGGLPVVSPVGSTLFVSKPVKNLSRSPYLVAFRSFR